MSTYLLKFIKRQTQDTANDKTGNSDKLAGGSPYTQQSDRRSKGKYSLKDYRRVLNIQMKPRQ